MKEKLERQLEQELDKDQESMDVEQVFQILGQLEKQQEKPSDVTQEDLDYMESLWEERRQLLPVLEKQERQAKWERKWRPITVATALVVVALCGLFVVPPVTMGAENLNEMAAWWTEDVFQLLVPKETTAQPSEDYEFHTDHPGLQQLYDAVAQIGDPSCVVPMWLPEGFELKEIKRGDSGPGSWIVGVFEAEEQQVSILVRQYEKEDVFLHEKAESSEMEFRWGGLNFGMANNNGTWIIGWLTGNFECTMTTSLDVDVVRDILRSIVK